MSRDIAVEAAEMLAAAGARDIYTYQNISPPGLAIHEMGTARMGRDPKTSVLNAHNQAHDTKNLFVTDGARMVSSSCVNPSLTYMALTTPGLRPRRLPVQKASELVGLLPYA